MMDLIVSWLSEAIAQLFQELMGFFSETFGYDISTFNECFPFAADVYEIIRKIGLALALVLAAWQVVQFFWRGVDKAADTPVRAVLNAILAVAFIYYGNYIFDLILKFCTYPYNALMHMDNTNGYGLWSNIGFVSSIFPDGSALLYLVMLILIGFSMVKLLLEIVERYVVAFVLVYLSPLAASTLACSPTSGIYKKYLTMFISQCILIFLNAWCLSMAVSGMSSIGGDGFMQNNDTIVHFLMCYAFLRVAQKMDSYLNQLGLNAAITGGGLGAELFGAAASLTGMGKGGGGGALGGAGKSNPILGAAKAAGTWARRASPLAAGFDVAKKAAVGGVSGAAKGASEAFRSGKSAYNAARASGSKPIAAMKAGVGATRTGAAYQAARAGGGSVGDGLKASINSTKTATAFQDARASGKNVLKSAGAAIGASNVGSGAGESIRTSDNMLANTARKYNKGIGAGHKPSLEDKLTGGDLTPEQHEAMLDDFSSHQSMAQEAFAYAKDNDLSVDNNETVAAVAKGLGVGEQSQEAAGIIQAGFDQNDEFTVPNSTELTMDKNGIHAECVSKDGYRHKMNVYDRSQYNNLSVNERETQNFQKFTATDGKSYYIGTSKSKVEPVPSVGKDGLTQTQVVTRNADGTTTEKVTKTITPDQRDLLSDEEKQGYVETRANGRKVFSSESYVIKDRAGNILSETTTPTEAPIPTSGMDHSVGLGRNADGTTTELQMRNITPAKYNELSDEDRKGYRKSEANGAIIYSRPEFVTTNKNGEIISRSSAIPNIPVGESGMDQSIPLGRNADGTSTDLQMRSITPKEYHDLSEDEQKLYKRSNVNGTSVYTAPEFVTTNRNGEIISRSSAIPNIPVGENGMEQSIRLGRNADGTSTDLQMRSITPKEYYNLSEDEQKRYTRGDVNGTSVYTAPEFVTKNKNGEVISQSSKLPNLPVGEGGMDQSIPLGRNSDGTYSDLRTRTITAKEYYNLDDNQKQFYARSEVNGTPVYSSVEVVKRNKGGEVVGSGVFIKPAAQTSRAGNSVKSGNPATSPTEGSSGRSEETEPTDPNPANADAGGFKAFVDATTNDSEGAAPQPAEDATDSSESAD